MRLFFDFTLLFVASVCSVIFLSPRTRSTWPGYLKVLMWGMLSGVLFVGLLMKPLYGRSPDELLGAGLFSGVCSIIEYSKQCPAAQLRRQEATAATTMNVITKTFPELIDFVDRKLSMAAPADHGCAGDIRSVELETRRNPARPRAVTAAFNRNASDSEEDFIAGNRFYFYGLFERHAMEGDIWVRCESTAGAFQEYRLPKETRACGHMRNRFICWNR